MLLFRESKHDDVTVADVDDMISFWICESTDCVKRSGEFSVHLCTGVVVDVASIVDDASKDDIGGVVGVVVKLLPFESLVDDCCIRFRYSFIESFRFGCGGGSGAERWGFKRGSWLAVFVCIFNGLVLTAFEHDVIDDTDGGGARGAAISTEKSLVEVVTAVIDETVCAVVETTDDKAGSFIDGKLFKPNRAVCVT